MGVPTVVLARLADSDRTPYVGGERISGGRCFDVIPLRRSPITDGIRWRVAIERRTGRNEMARRTSNESAAVLRSLQCLLHRRDGQAVRRSEILYGPSYVKVVRRGSEAVLWRRHPRTSARQAHYGHTPAGRRGSAITPSNFSNSMPARKVAPALLARYAIVSSGLAMLAERARLPGTVLGDHRDGRGHGAQDITRTTRFARSRSPALRRLAAP